VTVSPFGNCCVLSFRSITASRTSRSFLSDRLPVEKLEGDAALASDHQSSQIIVINNLNGANERTLGA